MISKVLYKLLIKSYERFGFFSRDLNLTIAKNINVNHQISKHQEKTNSWRKTTKQFNIQNFPKNSARRS